MPHSDRTVTTKYAASSNCDRWRRKKKGRASFLEGKGRDAFHCAAQQPHREQNMQLEQQYTVKWSLLELMSALSVHTLKCSLTRACSSSNKHKSSHNPISCPLIPTARREAYLGKRRTKESKQGPRIWFGEGDFDSSNFVRTFISW